ncbi:MAG: ATP-binding protein [Clostridia bacterium]|nr:ATP-binding protein [Clostridia bacterium]
MEDLSVSFLNDKFNMYYEAAKKAYAENKGELAKRNYLLAAETLLQLAKKSTPKLRKARTERARRLVEIAENIDVAIENNQVPNGGQQEKTVTGGDGAKEWTAAEVPDVHFSDIAGLEDVKKAITTRMINPIKYPDKYKLYNKKSGGGVLLYGPPGTGKTMIAKAIACEVGAKFYPVKGSDIVSKWVGESEKNINSLFKTARADDRAIIFIDEMDSLIGKRGVDTHNDKRVNEFLQQIDGFAGSSPNLLLLGATNRPWDIDGAAMRSGRFSQKIYVPLPDAPARKFMFEKALKGAPVAEDVSVEELVALSDGYSGADIEEVCDRAKEDPLLESIKTNLSVPVSRKHFIAAFAAVPPSVSKKEIERFEKYMKG